MSEPFDAAGFEGAAIRRRTWLAMWHALSVIEGHWPGKWDSVEADQRFYAALKVQTNAYKAARALQAGRRPVLGAWIGWADGPTEWNPDEHQ